MTSQGEGRAGKHEMDASWHVLSSTEESYGKNREDLYSIELSGCVAMKNGCGPLKSTR